MASQHNTESVHYLAGPDEIHGLLLEERELLGDLFAQELTNEICAEIEVALTRMQTLLKTYEGLLKQRAA